MLDIRGFDLWADGYDKDVGLSVEANLSPFAGYKAVLGRIFSIIMESGGRDVLDIGFGMGTLTARLYENGCRVSGQDFTVRMIALSQAKMPGARLYQGDFSKRLAEELRAGRYDFIVSTYALHHLTFPEKFLLINQLRGLLKPGGALLIGDVAFESAESLEKCRAAAGGEWGDDDIYFAYYEMQRAFPGMEFEKLSFCAGLLTLKEWTGNMEVRGAWTYPPISKSLRAIRSSWQT